MNCKFGESILNSRRTEKIVIFTTASRFVLGHPASHPMGIMNPFPAVQRIKRATNPSITLSVETHFYSCIRHK